jgi:fluoroacetyl-CoA thioesterase
MTATTLIGLRHSERLAVERRHTVPEVEPSWPGFADMPPVLATAMMVGFIEQTCILALRPYLEAGQHTVGTAIEVSHVATTPVGMAVTAEVELVAIEGRSLLFRVRCSDDAGPVGEGTHRRAIIEVERFMGRLQAKSASMRP